MINKKTDLRITMVETFQRVVEEGFDIRILVSDSTSTSKIQPFFDKYPDRVINVGIAEQNLIGIGAGLAIGGMIPISTNAACFLTTRSNEQIKNDVCYSNLNIKLVGLNAGFAYGALGSTHHAIDDISIMSGLGNIQIFAPADSIETREIFKYVISMEGPAYIRLDSAMFPEIHNDDYVFTPGKIDILQKGEDISIFALGSVVHEAYEAAEMLSKTGINAEVINISSIRPLDEMEIIKSIEKTKKVITVEEHSLHGGVSSIISSIIARNNLNPKFVELGIPRGEFALAGPRDELRDYYKINAAGIVAAGKSIVKGKAK